MDRLIILELIGAAFLIIILGYFILKKGKLNLGKSGNNIQELERFQYTPNSFLSLVMIEEEIILIGITESSISILKEFKDEKIKEKIIQNNLKDNKESNFKDFFVLNNQENSKRLKDKLKKMRK
ncbi:MAG: flagellar biosynthetic protein FliO [Fusobacteriota bacterium]